MYIYIYIYLYMYITTYNIDMYTPFSLSLMSVYIIYVYV